jgi:hypothetical protein
MNTSPQNQDWEDQLQAGLGTAPAPDFDAWCNRYPEAIAALTPVVPPAQETIIPLEPEADGHADTKSDASETAKTRKPLLSARPVSIAVVTSLAASLLVLVAWWGTSRQSAWAEVMEAVAKKPWLHAVTTHRIRSGEAVERELWFSASHGVRADRFGEELIWTDSEIRTNETYSRKENTIVRTRYDERDDKRHELSVFFEAIFEAFLSAQAGHTVASGPFKLVHQQQRAVKQEGKRWIEHRFTMLRDGKPSKQEWVVYVDSDTQLPFRWETIDRYEGQIGGQRWDVDYPDTGPASIYAMGAPRTAKVVDLLEKPLNADVKQLLAGVKAAMWRSDRYFTLVVESREDQHWSQSNTVFRIWRNGPRWKVERSFGRVTRFDDELAPEDADAAIWWREKAETLRFVPYEVCDAEWIWRYKVNTRSPTREDIEAGAPDDTKVLVSVDKRRERRVIGRQQNPASYGRAPRPEVSGRFHVGSLADTSKDFRMPEGYEVTVDPHPTSGPPNTVLVEFRNLLWDPANAKRPRGRLRSFPQIERFWIDQKRGYLVMRRDLVITRDGQEEVVAGSLIEGVTQSPQGHWYPTIVRSLNANLLGDKWQDGIKRYYYDFDAPMPDSLFEAD